MEFDVSVILINYNSSEFTLSCVESILKNTKGTLNYNIVIVDNASEYEDYKKLESLKELKNVQVIRSKLNVGFSAGNMYGTTFTNAKYYFFLNNDCVLKNDCITILFDYSEKNRHVGMCSPQLYSKENNPISSFNYFPLLMTKILGLGILMLIKGKEFKPRKAVYTEPTKVDLISGSQMFIQKDAFNKFGGFDTNYFLYCEEEDLAINMHKHNYDVYLIPEAKNHHIGGCSSPASFDIRKEFYISFLYFYRKHYGFLKTEIIKVLLFLKILRKSFKCKGNFRLSFFILSGAHMKNSLRFKQKIID